MVDGSIVSDFYMKDRVCLQDDTAIVIDHLCILNLNGLYIPEGKTLTIYVASTATLISKAKNGGAGIGGYSGHNNGNIIIHGGNLEVEGDDNCAGIGSNDGKTTGSITIYNCNSLKATGGSNGAGIGGGLNGDGGTIHIYGSYVSSVSGTGKDNAVGIGGGGGSKATNANVLVEGFYARIFATGAGKGAGIGGGGNGSATVDIRDGNIEATGGTSGGAAIGSGASGAASTINISGGVIEARGTVGMGNKKNESNITLTVTGVTLNDKTLTANTDYTVTGVTATDAGTYTVTVTGKGNYTGTATATWTIVPGDMTVTAEDVVVGYDGAPHGITVNVTKPVSGATLMYGTKLGKYSQAASPTQTDAGTLVVYYQVTADNYNAFTGHATVTVEQASIAPKVIIDGWTYGMTPNVPDIIDNPGDGVVSYSYSDAENGKYTEAVPTDAGIWYVRASVAESANYTAAITAPVRFTISPARISITADDKSSAYGEDIQALTWQVVGSVVEGDDLGISASTAATSTSDVGKYDITLSWNHNPNYNPRVKNGTYTITKASLPVVASGYSGEYDGKDHGITVKMGQSDAVVYYAETELTGQDYATAGSTTNPAYTKVGEYTVYFYVATGGNYEPDPASGSQTVRILKARGSAQQQPTPANPTWTGKAQPLVKVPDSLPEGYIKCLYSTDGGVTWTQNIPVGTDAGDYTVDVKYVGDENHEDFTGDSIKCAIRKAAPTVTAPTAKTLTYTGSAQQLVNPGNATGGTLQYSLDGKAWSTAVPSAAEAGSYTVYYKVAGDKNHTDVSAKSVEVTIVAKQNPTVPLTKTPEETVEPTVTPTVTPEPTDTDMPEPTVTPKPT